MRYLKNFNESKERRFSNDLEPEEGELEELKDFCETHLVYLVDQGIEIKILNDYGHKCFSISITKEGSIYRGFNWEEVKDYFIPFLTHLSRRYSICHEDLKFRPLVDGIPKTYVYYDVDRVVSQDDFTKLPFSNQLPKSAWLQLYPISSIEIEVEYKMNLEN